MTLNWFITGTSSGFGRIITEKLLARGDRVTATLRKPGPLDDLKERHPGNLDVVLLDVTDMGAVSRAVDEAFARMGRIDVVVNNAGYGLFGAAEEVTGKQIRHQIDTNIMGSIEVIRASLPHMRAQGGGRVIQISSAGGQLAHPGFSLYHTTKWGIEGFVEAVALEVAPFGIEFTIVEPGATKTKFGEGLVMSKPMAAYDETPVGAMRRGSGGSPFGVQGDAEKSVDAMIASVDTSPAPRRLVLGSSAHTRIREALEKRLAELDAQKDIAFSADADS
ncbi:SDR family oxidoreductase [Parvibaculum sp.]|uniref:SDR family oxidoreductase n=1 Tax=Parvibaculum sp. TaxID=2024848 RepID=UPI003BAC1039